MDATQISGHIGIIVLQSSVVTTPNRREKRLLVFLSLFLAVPCTTCSWQLKIWSFVDVWTKIDNSSMGRIIVRYYYFIINSRSWSYPPPPKKRPWEGRLRREAKGCLQNFRERTPTIIQIHPVSWTQSVSCF